MAAKFRILIVFILLVGLVLLAGRNVASADPVGGNDRAVQPRDPYSPASGKPDPGSVKPPPGDVTFCEDGNWSVGGVSTLEVTDLAPGYCIVAFLRNHAFAVGRIPDGAGGVLAHITFVRIFYHGKLVSNLPEEDGQAEICYAMPPGKSGQIYFFDFYGPRFGERNGQPSWEPLETNVSGGMACGAAQTTGAYALIGQ